jgi:hypothetical protein
MGFSRIEDILRQVAEGNPAVILARWWVTLR